MGASVGVQAADLAEYPAGQPTRKEGQTTVAAPGSGRLNIQAPGAATQFKIAPNAGATQMKDDGQKELNTGVR